LLLHQQLRIAPRHWVGIVCVNISIDFKHLFETFQNRTSSEPSDGLVWWRTCDEASL